MRKFGNIVVSLLVFLGVTGWVAESVIRLNWPHSEGGLFLGLFAAIITVEISFLMVIFAVKEAVKNPRVLFLFSIMFVIGIVALSFGISSENEIANQAAIQRTVRSSDSNLTTRFTKEGFHFSLSMQNPPARLLVDLRFPQNSGHGPFSLKT